MPSITLIVLIHHPVRDHDPGALADGQGIGYLPAVIAVLLYSLLPIVRNTYPAIHNVDPALREAARDIVSDDFSNEPNWLPSVRCYAMTYGPR